MADASEIVIDLFLWIFKLWLWVHLHFESVVTKLQILVQITSQITVTVKLKMSNRPPKKTKNWHYKESRLGWMRCDTQGPLKLPIQSEEFESKYINGTLLHTRQNRSFLNFTTLTPRTFLHSIHQLDHALYKYIQKQVKTPTYFGTGVQSSGSYSERRSNKAKS